MVAEDWLGSVGSWHGDPPESTTFYALQGFGITVGSAAASGFEPHLSLLLTARDTSDSSVVGWCLGRHLARQAVFYRTPIRRNLPSCHNLVLHLQDLTLFLALTFYT